MIARVLEKLRAGAHGIAVGGVAPARLRQLPEAAPQPRDWRHAAAQGRQQHKAAHPQRAPPQPQDDNARLPAHRALSRLPPHLGPHAGAQWAAACFAAVVPCGAGPLAHIYVEHAASARPHPPSLAPGA
eukprot:scaffold4753_cov266-Prasinococcus_capsulatus_cf.AAC.2